MRLSEQRPLVTALRKETLIYTPIEMKPLGSKKVAAAKIIAINSIYARRVDLSKPAPVRVLTGAASGKHRKVIPIYMYRPYMLG